MTKAPIHTVDGGLDGGVGVAVSCLPRRGASERDLAAGGLRAAPVPHEGRGGAGASAPGKAGPAEGATGGPNRPAAPRGPPMTRGKNPGTRRERATGWARTAGPPREPAR